MTQVRGVALGPGQGQPLLGGGMDATIKVTMSHPAFASMFELRVPPGFDVGAHVHGQGEEVFYVVRGQLDVLAFEPRDRSATDWHTWESAAGERFLRGGPGAFLYVPPGVPHAFGNPTDAETVVFFQSSVPGGHENYFRELADLLARTHGRPPEAEAIELRRRYQIEQITGVRLGH